MALTRNGNRPASTLNYDLACSSFGTEVDAYRMNYIFDWIPRSYDKAEEGICATIDGRY
jgi:hypothetical protein